MWLFCCSHSSSAVNKIEQPIDVLRQTKKNLYLQLEVCVFKNCKLKKIIWPAISNCLFSCLCSRKSHIKDGEGQWKATLTRIITFTTHYITQEEATGFHRHQKHTAAAIRMKRWSCSGFVTDATESVTVLTLMSGRCLSSEM